MTMTATVEKMRSVEPVRPSESRVSTYRNCCTCQRRTPVDQMHDQWECQECRDDYLDKRRRRKLTEELVQQKKALGQAVQGMVRQIGAGKFMPSEPHILWGTLLEKFGGVDGVCTIIFEEFMEQRNKTEGKSGKVIVDFLKMLLNLNVEATKSAPQPLSFDDMSNEEIAEFILKAAQKNLEDSKEAERLAGLPVELLPEYDDQSNVYARLALQAQQSQEAVKESGQERGAT